MILTNKFHILTTVVCSENNTYTDQSQPMLFNSIEDAENFITSDDEQLISKNVEDFVITYHTYYESKHICHMLWL